jgi:8-oxo-dGTP diphosphatase
MRGNKHQAVATSLPARPRGREFPEYPRVGVGGILIHRGRVLLVQRGQEPLKGRWTLPGGLVESGEGLTQAVRRELKEETGLSVEPVEMAGVFERIERDSISNLQLEISKGRPRYHYVIIDYICRLRAAERRRPWPPAPIAATDITAAEWVEIANLKRYRLTVEAEEVIRKAASLVDEE